MASAVKAKVVALFINGQKAIGLCTLLQELGHLQPQTAMKNNNATASGLTNATMKQRCSKAMDMRFHWIKDWIQQEQLLVYWHPGVKHFADYFTKHHNIHHHIKMHNIYLSTTTNSDCATTLPHPLLQGCVN